jgi:hypothetical protein
MKGELNVRSIDVLIKRLEMIRDNMNGKIIQPKEQETLMKNVTSQIDLSVLNHPFPVYLASPVENPSPVENQEVRRISPLSDHSLLGLSTCKKCGKHEAIDQTEGLCESCRPVTKKRGRTPKQPAAAKNTKKKNKKEEEESTNSWIPFKVDIPLSERARVEQIIAGKASNLTKDQKLAFIKSYVDDQDPKFELVVQELDKTSASDFGIVHAAVPEINIEHHNFQYAVDDYLKLFN